MCKVKLNQCLCTSTTELYDAAILRHTCQQSTEYMPMLCLLAVETVLEDPAAKQDLETDAVLT